jgi:tryptophanyl-tRNA synthetase
MDLRVVMSGMRPTGALHLGHWQGALKNWLDLQQKHRCHFSIVDWHALTTEYQHPENIGANIREVLLDWLSVGIDPDRSVLYVQSAVPEIAELFLLLGMLTPLGWLERVPTFKEQQQQLKDRDLNTFGFLGYPLLMTVDIVIMRADIVPVGEDQVYHVELAREIVRRFNALYGPCFPEPQEFLTPIPKLPGLDGRKMSKSYENAIFLKDGAETVAKKINPMITDVRRQRRSDPGVPEDCPVFAFHQAFSAQAEIDEVSTECRRAGIGCLDCKRIVISTINAFLEPFRARRAQYESGDIGGILESGNGKARVRAGRTLEDVRRLVKL